LLEGLEQVNNHSLSFEGLAHTLEDMQQKAREAEAKRVEELVSQAARTGDGFAPLPNQNPDSLEFHSLVVDHYQNMHKLKKGSKQDFLARKKARKHKREVKKASAYEERLGSKKSKLAQKNKKRNQAKNA